MCVCVCLCACVRDCLYARMLAFLQARILVRVHVACRFFKKCGWLLVGQPTSLSLKFGCLHSCGSCDGTCKLACLTYTRLPGPGVRCNKAWSGAADASSNDPVSRCKGHCIDAFHVDIFYTMRMPHTIYALRYPIIPSSTLADDFPETWFLKTR